MEPNLSHEDLGSDDEIGFSVGNEWEGSLENGEVDILEESGSEEEESKVNSPPPIPPRSHSLSPSPSFPPFLKKSSTKSGKKANIYADKQQLEHHMKSRSPFLSEERGGEKLAPPLPRLVNGIANGEVESSSPPPLPTKVGRRRSCGPKLQGIAEEERMLINELDLLEKMVDEKEEAASSGSTAGGEVRDLDKRTEAIRAQEDTKA